MSSKNYKPHLGPSLQLTCVDQSTAVGSGRDWLQSRAQWALLLAGGRLGSDYSQDVSNRFARGVQCNAPMADQAQTFQALTIRHI
jgi:hypothetical protein